MNNSVYRFFGLLALLLFAHSIAVFATTVDFFLLPAPKYIREDVMTKLIGEGVLKKKLEKLGTRNPLEVGRKLFKHAFKQFLPEVSGFVALYGGYVDYSDRDGSLSFPLLHKEKLLHLVVTPDINAVPLYGNTIAHEGLTKSDVEIYSFEQKVDPKKIRYWEVKKIERPDHNQIGPLSVILLTKTKNIVVPTGDFMANENPNLVLPKVYVTGNIGNAKSILDFLDIRRFFEPVEVEEKATDKILQKLIKNN